MCGIAGYFGSRRREKDQLDRCMRVMRHRGPDFQSSYSYQTTHERHVHLVHARLNIIDLDPRANQPFRIGHHLIAYNGELYNYIELKKQLEADGVTFATQSDTEVLLQTWIHYGMEGLDRAEGMWSFALFDEQSEQLMLCRDRFSEKPLFIFEEESGLYFGSEPKAIMALSGKKLQPNMHHLQRYMINGYKALYKYEDTFFEGLRRLPPAHCLTIIRDGQQTTEAYWQPVFEPNLSMTYQQAVDGVRERLIESVKLRLRADVPLAFCMSGGIDSNALISIAKNEFQYDVHGFTIVNKDERYAEDDMVQHAVDKQNLRHTSIAVNTDDFLPNMRQLVKQHDSPVCTISYYAHWLLMRGVSEAGYKISVSGTAADELFTGYYDHHLFYLAEIQNEGGHFLRSVKNWETHIQPIVRNPFLQDPYAFVKQPQSREHIFLNADGFSDYFYQPWNEAFSEQDYGLPLLRNRMWNELFAESVPVILHEDDLNAMSFSIENRSPFLDRNLFEFTCQIPSRHLIKDGKAKSVLRDAMKGIAPEHIMENRRKVGFNAPIFSFLDIHDPSIQQEILKDSPIYDFVRRDAIEAFFKKGELPNSESKFLFYFLASKYFLEECAA